MKNTLYFKQIQDSMTNGSIVQELETYVEDYLNEQIYVVNSPLGEKYTYAYQDNAVVILSPKHKIIFIDLKGNREEFNEYYEDFIEDLNSISDKFEYKEFIGRPREWKKNNTIQIQYTDFTNFVDVFADNILALNLQRISELLISLIIGSINDIHRVGGSMPETLLERVKKNIILFDGEQTRFIYKDFNNKTVTIQGLSGTGKTELLLHKLKEIYIKEDDVKVYLTCHNIALSNILKDRVPSFFNFMKVDKQIEWNSKLWVSHAWGSKNIPNSGFYSYLCTFYNVPFLRYSTQNNYEKIFDLLLAHVNSLEDHEFTYALDYILIDERQDFPDVFFELCEKIARKKVYIAGDIFQDIFENTEDTKLKVDIVLNRCYRTDPRTLMFAHAIGLGLFEDKKLNWFSDVYWKAIGYDIERFEDKEIHFLREPIRRFENLETENYDSIVYRDTTKVSDVVAIIKELKLQHVDLLPDDVAIIIMEENQQAIYKYVDNLAISIGSQLGWKSNRAYENKRKIEDTIYISNANNVKGLEFPFVICITASIKNSYRYRNILYTMLTRSFIQSFLLISNSSKMLDINLEGLKIINCERFIKTTEPSAKEKKEIESKLLTFNKNNDLSYDDFLTEIFEELKIDVQFREKFINLLLSTEIERFDKKKTIRFIKANKEFYSE